jgi:hypothetical protein
MSRTTTARFRWLILNPSRWTIPSHALSPETRAKRDALRRGDPETVQEAIAEIETNTSHERQWWCLEGTTRVDCALLTEKAVIFVEGKRTESGPSAAISWYAKRDQVLRILDCARWYAMRTGLEYYAMLIIEDDPEKIEVAKQTGRAETFENSFPHLSPRSRQIVEKRYLGVATWKQVSDAFRL